MDAVNLHTMVNLTGGTGEDLTGAIAAFDRTFPRRFVSMTEPSWTRASETGYAAWQADEIGKAKAAGAVGVKVLKTLGLYLRDGGPSGKLVRVDDARFDPMWETCGRLGLPVAIHVGDPEAFFLPIDRFNERYEELNAHPDWSFHGKDFPAFKEILDARDRVFARHPKTTFVALHVGHWGENLAAVGEMLDKFPNVHVEIGARIGELGRQPRTAAQVLRSLPGPHPVRHRRRSARRRNAAAGVRRRPVPDLLPLSRDRGRILRLRAGAGAAAGPVEDLRPGAPGTDPAQGLLPERRARARYEAGHGLSRAPPASHSGKLAAATAFRLKAEATLSISRFRLQRTDSSAWLPASAGRRRLSPIHGTPHAAFRPKAEATRLTERLGPLTNRIAPRRRRRRQPRRSFGNPHLCPSRTPGHTHCSSDRHAREGWREGS